MIEPRIIFLIQKLDKSFQVLYIIIVIVKKLSHGLEEQYNPKYASYKERLRDQAR